MDLESKNLKTLGEREEKILDLENEVSDLSGKIVKFEEQEKNLLSCNIVPVFVTFFCLF